VRFARASGWLFAGVLLLSAVGGFLLYRLSAPKPTLYAEHTGVPAPTAPAAEPAEGAESPAIARKIPERLPAITLPGLDGAPVSLSRWRGRSLLVNFWAPWCEPCRREMPLLQRIRRERAKDGFEIVGIAIDPQSSVRKYVTDHGIDYPILVGDKGGLEAATAFGLEPVLPFSVFADRKGEIVTVKVGELHQDETNLILDRLHDLDTGRLTLPLARQAIAEGTRGLGGERPEPAEGIPH